MPTKAGKQLLRFLEDNGFEWARTNSKRMEFYVHPECGEVRINMSTDDRTAKHIIVDLQKRLGIITIGEQSKRDPEAIRERQAAERAKLAADIERHESEIAILVIQREARMDGLGKMLSGSELRAIERLIEQKEHEKRGWQRLMQELPSVNAHSGRNRAEHRA